MEYSQEWADGFCELIAQGKSVRAICEMPGQAVMSSVFKWLGAHPEFAEQYARAKEQAAEGEASRILEIADDPDLDHNNKKVMIDARKWIASKLLPKKYGDKVETEHSGTIEVIRRNVTDA